MTLRAALEIGDIGCEADFALFQAAPKTVEFNKLRKRLLRATRQALDRFRHGHARGALAGGALRRQGLLRAARRPARS